MQITTIAGPNLQVVPSGAQAVVVNLTAVNHGSTVAYVTAFPAGTLPSRVINLDPGAVQSNLAIVQLTSSGAITLYNAVGKPSMRLSTSRVSLRRRQGSGSDSRRVPQHRADSDVRLARQTTAPLCAGAINKPTPRRTRARKLYCARGPGTKKVPSTGHAEAAAAVFNLAATSEGPLSGALSVAPPNGKPISAPRARKAFSNLNPKAGGSLPVGLSRRTDPANDVCIYNAVGQHRVHRHRRRRLVPGHGSRSSTGALFYSVPPTRDLRYPGGHGNTVLRPDAPPELHGSWASGESCQR